MIQPLYRFFKRIGKAIIFQYGNGKDCPMKRIKPPTTSNNSFSPALTYTGKKMRVKFDGSCLKQDKILFSHRTNRIFTFCTR